MPDQEEDSLAGLKRRSIPGVVHAPVAHDHGGSALIALRVILLPHAEWLDCEPVLLYLQHEHVRSVSLAKLNCTLVPFYLYMGMQSR